MQRLGINYNKAAGIPVTEAFPLFHTLGFDAIFTGYFKSTDAMAPYAEEAAKNGLFYESLHAPFGHINDIWYETEAGDCMQKELTDCIESAGVLQIPIVVVHLSSGEQAPPVCDTGRRRWDAIVESAVKHHVTIAFENQRKLANLAFVMELYADVPEVGFCWDVGHEKCFAHGMEYMPLFGKKLVYTHIHDNFGGYNEDFHMIPFDGSIDFTRTAELLRRAEYQGTLTLELLPKHSPYYEGISMEIYYRKAYEAAEKLRKMISAAI